MAALSVLVMGYPCAVGIAAPLSIVRGAGDEAITAMRQAGLVPVLVTGDKPRAAAAIAAQVGIEAVHAARLPGDKAGIIRDLQRSGRVATVGDGINDAPALRQADLAEAIGRPQSFISKYERGQRRLDLVELRMVCSAYSTTLRKLVSEYERRLESMGER